MIKLASIIVLYILTSSAGADFCEDNFTLAELPKGLLVDFVNLYTKGVLAGIVGCSEEIQIEEHHIRFWLWTNENPETPIILDHQNPIGLHANQPVIFLIHGWLCNVTSDRVPELKRAYLQRYSDVSVVAVEWTTYAVDIYANVFCNVPHVAQVVAKFINNVRLNYKIDLDEIHLVGHSMGGQISGLAGQEVLSRTGKKIGRITALDPAGPLYQLVSEDRRLDASDANIVDVIHTNQFQAGYFGNCGTADFYPNCGYFQPGCFDSFNISAIGSMLDIPLRLISCSHLRSADYHIESIFSDKFWAYSCSICPGLPLVGPCITNLFAKSISIMGENYPYYASDGEKYYLSTKSSPPFAKGFY